MRKKGAAMKKEKFKYFKNSECEYFPCHNVNDDEEFNCLFCYCPLYALGSSCGGNFMYTDDGIKDCSACTIPHSEDGYEHILKQYDKIRDIASKNR